jgi:hypothetical protein
MYSTEAYGEELSNGEEEKNREERVTEQVNSKDIKRKKK